MHPQPRLVQRKAEQRPEEGFRLEEDVHNVLHQVRSWPADEDARGVPPTDRPGVDDYSSSLSSVHRVFHTLLTERFLEELPGTAVCLLSGRQDCGPEADLAKAVSLDLIKPLLRYVSTVRSQTCAPGRGDAESARATHRTGESASGTFLSFQQWLADALSSLTSSGNLLATLSGLVDATMTHSLKVLATLLQVPLDYVKLVLQFGIRTPSLEGKETCEQGRKTLLNR